MGFLYLQFTGSSLQWALLLWTTGSRAQVPCGIWNLPGPGIELASSALAAAAAKSLQSCLTLCDPTDGSPPGSPVPGILQARTLGWVAISFSNA